MDPLALWIVLGAVALGAVILVGVAASTRRARINRGKPTEREEPGQPYNREKPFTDSGDTSS